MNMREKLASVLSECGAAADWDHALVAADAVLDALLDPTPEMIAAGESSATIGIGKPNDDEALPRVWQSMILAAKNGP